MKKHTKPNNTYPISLTATGDIYLPKENLTLSEWGLEFSDSVAFFSLKGKGQYYKESQYTKSINAHTVSTGRDVQLHDGIGTLSTSLKIDGKEVKRKDTFTATKPTELLDFVMRFVFPKSLFTQAHINNTDIQHKNENIYHQSPVSSKHNSVTLAGKTLQVKIQTGDLQVPEGFAPHLYVRDEPESWIVHLRLLPVEADKTITKLNYSFYNKALPPVIQKMLSALQLQNRLQYRGEKKQHWSPIRTLIYRLLPLSSYPLGKLETGTKIILQTSCLFEEIHS